VEDKIPMILKEAGASWDRVKDIKPLIYHITNFVAMPEQAHATLAIGASPVMALSEDESGEMCSNADALLINIGTPSKEQLKAMIKAQKVANKKGIPVLLDPVGYGATEFRNFVVNKILKKGKVSVIKGNSGEILALSGKKGVVRGVDSLDDNHKLNLVTTLKELSRKYNSILIATGKEDLLTDGKKTILVSGGSHLIKYITGSGCILGSVIASILGTGSDLFIASISGLVAFKIISEKAKDKGIGTFRVKIFDELFTLRGDEIANRRECLRWI